MDYKFTIPLYTNKRESDLFLVGAHKSVTISTPYHMDYDTNAQEQARA